MDQHRSSRRNGSHKPCYRSNERGRRRHSRSTSRSVSQSIVNRKLVVGSTRKARTRTDFQNCSRSRSRSRGRGRGRSRSRSHSRGHSRSASREYCVHRGGRSDRPHFSRSPSASREHYLPRREKGDRHYRSHSRSCSHSASRKSYLHQGTRCSRDGFHSGVIRSRSGSTDASRWVVSRHRRSPSPRRKSSHTWQRSPSARGDEHKSSRQRSRNSYYRSSSSRELSPAPKSLRSHYIERCSSSVRRSCSTSRRRVSLQKHISADRLCGRDVEYRNRSISVGRQSRSPIRHWRSQSRSVSRRRQEASAASQTQSSRGHSNSRYSAAEHLQTSASNLTLKYGPDEFIDVKQTTSQSKSVGTNENLKTATGIYEDSSSIHRDSHDRLLSHLSHDDCATSSSPAPHGSASPAKVTVFPKRVTVSPPQCGRITMRTSTNQISGNGSHRLIDPIMEKKREALLESHRTWLKSKSDFNRAEMKYVSIEAELQLAEFWLDIVTKNLKDVGKRIEVHDWNFQKITNVA
ncbi:hypothetical protein Plhal703r1_c09g0046681 [Plasmopara halstedii]